MKKSKIFATIAFSSSLLLLNSCYAFFQEKVPININGSNSTLSSLLNPPKKISSLEAPTQLFASQALHSDKIIVSWNQVDYATSYRIERAVSTPQEDGQYKIPEEADYKVLSEFEYNTVYSDKILQNPTTTNPEYQNKYFYRVCAENIGDKLTPSEYTDPTQEKTNGCGWLLNVPKNVEAEKGKDIDSIKITWLPVQNASHYKIYRTERQDGTGQELISTIRSNESSYIDPILKTDQGKEYFYTVVAQTRTGTTSVKSDIAMGYSLKEGAPQEPSNLIVENGLGTSTQQITLKWDEAPDTIEGTTRKYALYRTSSVDSIYTRIGGDLDKTTTSYTVSSNLKPGVYYYFYLQTIDTKVNEDGTVDILKSPFTETGANSKTPAMGFLLSPPQTIEVLDGSTPDKTLLKWKGAIGSELESLSLNYSVYSSQDKDGTYSLMSEATNIKPTQDENGYYFIELPKQNFYKITTINEEGTDKESDFSNPVAPMPEAPINVKASKTEKLDLNFVANQNGVYPVKVTWQKPQNDTPYYYNVYRSTKKDSGFRKLTETPLSSTTFEYIDINETALAGTYYYYKVVSLNILEQGTKSNNPLQDANNNCAGYGALTPDQWFREFNKTSIKSQTRLTLMHKPNDLDKLGQETANGGISGTLLYHAQPQGIGAYIIMKYTNYAEFYIQNDKELGVYFVFNGNTDTTSNMSANGHMIGDVVCTGMYPGTANYDHLEIKGGAAGAGHYGVTTRDLNGNTIFTETDVPWQVGEER